MYAKQRGGQRKATIGKIGAGLLEDALEAARAMPPERVAMLEADKARFKALARSGRSTPRGWRFERYGVLVPSKRRRAELENGSALTDEEADALKEAEAQWRQFAPRIRLSDAERLYLQRMGWTEPK